MPGTTAGVLYVDSDESHELVITMGDMVRATDWEKKEREDKNDFPDQMKTGLYAAFLSARRSHLPHTDGEFLDWADFITVPDADETDADAPEDEALPGE